MAAIRKRKRATGDVWIVDYRDLSPSTRRGYEQILKHHLRPAFGPMKVRALHVGHIKALLAEKRTAGYSKNMVRLMRATLSVLLGAPSRRGFSARTPWSSSPSGGVGDESVRWLWLITGRPFGRSAQTNFGWRWPQRQSTSDAFTHTS
jgi:hypothetical protein